MRGRVPDHARFCGVNSRTLCFVTARAGGLRRGRRNAEGPPTEKRCLTHVFVKHARAGGQNVCQARCRCACQRPAADLLRIQKCMCEFRCTNRVAQMRTTPNTHTRGRCVGCLNAGGPGTATRQWPPTGQCRPGNSKQLRVQNTNQGDCARNARILQHYTFACKCVLGPDNH